VNQTPRRRIIFITGTDTGVGKTVLTGMLLQCLRHQGCQALAMKPFCSGGRGDVNFLRAIQHRELTPGEVNPFYFAEPLAPLVAARKQGRSIRLPEVLQRIFQVASRCECLLIEGSGGLLVPLGEGYSLADLIAKLNCEIIVVARNQLGTINHTLLTVRTLQHIGIQKLKIVLMSMRRPDVSSDSNVGILAELLGQVPLVSFPFLGAKPLRLINLKKNEKKIKKTLARILS
jgi:dethiobiotin synthetase